MRECSTPDRHASLWIWNHCDPNNTASWCRQHLASGNLETPPDLAIVTIPKSEHDLLVCLAVPVLFVELY
jgi:hypothetical protein